MRAYASISPMFWTRGSGKRLRGDATAQLVALYLMSSPATSMIGIFHLALPTLCHETGLTLEEATKGLERCSEEGLCFWDETEELVFVPALAKHQIGEELSPKDHKVKGVARALAPFKGHRFYSMFVERYADSYRLQDEDKEAPSKPHTRDDVPVHGPAPVPISSPGTATAPPVDPGARNIQALAARALKDRYGSELSVGDAVTWPEVRAVVAAFKLAYGRSDEPRHGGDSRAQVILERLADGFTAEALVVAVTRSPWAEYMAKESNQSLKTILKDGASVDRFTAMTGPERPKIGLKNALRQPDSGHQAHKHAREIT